MNILSLFDGMSCGQQALERAGFKVDNYFASEIDKYAIQVTMANYPNTIQLGSVVNVDGYSLPKIDLLIGGSPCQSFSFAGKRKGMATKCETEILTLEHYLELKEQGFEFEGQSYLFWEFMRLLNECKPKYFLLENVEMGEKWEKVLSKAIGVNGIHINSSLVSAQNRKRIYWTNIGLESAGLFGDLESIIQQPKDKGILLKDILEKEVDEKYFLSEKMIAGFERHKERHNEKGTGFGYVPKNEDDKGNSLRANAALAPTDNMLIVHNTMQTYCLDTGNTNAVEIVGLTEVRTEEAKQIRRETGTNPKRAKELVERTDGKTGAILTSQTKDNLVKIVENYPTLTIANTETNLLFHRKGFMTNTQTYGIDGKCGTLDTAQGGGRNAHTLINSRIRRLTPLEYERLQTVKDNYTNHVSDSQRYKMLGNGWTVDVIAHIFSYMK